MTNDALSTEVPVYERMEGEPLLWFRRFEKFRLMEPVRSVTAVYTAEHPTSNDVKSRQNVPGAWYEKAKEWRWDERAAAWDAFLDEKLEQQIRAERKKVLQSCFALMHKRVEAMNALVTRLLLMTAEDRNIWLKDVKSIGTGPNAKQVDLVQFNEGLFREIRGFFADIAAEMGERVKVTKQDSNIMLDILSGSHEALLADLAALPDVTQSQEQDIPATADPA